MNSYVIVEKEIKINSSSAHAPNHTIKMKLRICLDPKDLNEALEQEPYYSRTVDELISKFNGAVFFTIVDLEKGYWQVHLHPDLRKYTCMALDIGRFQWKRLPMGYYRRVRHFPTQIRWHIRRATWSYRNSR